MIVNELTPGERDWAMELVTMHFGSPCVVSRGRVHDTRVLPAIIARRDGQKVGLLLFSVEARTCEVVVLVATRPRQGIGRVLVENLVQWAQREKWQRLWAVSTNDNVPAIAFYPAIGWRLVNIHHGAVSEARRLKAQIPPTGWNGIPIEDEIEFELRFDYQSPNSTPINA